MSKLRLLERVLSACGILGLVGAIVVYDLGCIGGGSSGPADPTTPLVTSVTVQPNPASVRVGGNLPLHADILPYGGGVVSWVSSNPGVATVSGNTKDASVTGVSAGTTTVTATVGGKTGTVQVTVSDVPVATVTVSGASTILLQTTTQFTVTAKDDAGNVLTGRQVDWSSSASVIASVSQTGVVTGNTVGGPATISATIEHITGSAQISVTGPPIASIAVFGQPSITVGSTTTFTVILKDAAGNTLTNRFVDWSSSNPGIASVSSVGTVTGVTPGGPVTITASSEGKSAGAPISVTAPSVLAGRVINFVSGAGIGGATVNFRANDGGAGSLWGSTTSAGDGSFTSPASSTGISSGVLVEASATGFTTGRILVASVPFGATVFVGDVPLAPSSGMTGGISGTTRNALTGGGLSGATVSVFDNITTGAIATQTSDGSGNFSFTGLQAGTYRLSATATGYQNSQRVGVAVGNGGVTGNQDLVLSPSGTNAVTIVLTWGSSPSDLDSHLTGPNGAGRFHVFYGSRGNLTAAPFAKLDVDDVSGFGPETVSITQLSAGTYRYSVHDFSNRSSTTSTALGSSGAKVQVYTAAGLANTFFVPGGAGTLWTVFELSGTLASPLITPVNIKSFASDPSSISSPPVAWAGATTDGGLIGRAAGRHPKPNP